LRVHFSIISFTIWYEQHSTAQPPLQYSSTFAYIEPPVVYYYVRHVHLAHCIYLVTCRLSHRVHPTKRRNFFFPSIHPASLDPSRRVHTRSSAERTSEGGSRWWFSRGGLDEIYRRIYKYTQGNNSRTKKVSFFWPLRLATKGTNKRRSPLYIRRPGDPQYLLGWLVGGGGGSCLNRRKRSAAVW
jgi:hypothetical protein